MPPENTAVLEQVQKEIKGFGDNVKDLRDSMQKDLAEVRQIAEDAKGASEHPEVKSQVQALTLSVAEKHKTLEDLVGDVKGQADKLETALNRSPLGGENDNNDEGIKHAAAFWTTKMAADGSLKVSNRPTSETADIEGYKAWEKAYDTYLRVKDERAIEEKALSVGSNPDGGYLVPTAQSNRIISKIYESSPLRQLSTIETIGTSELELPIDQDEGDAGWVGEEQVRSETRTPQVGVQKIPVHEIYAKPKVTQKFLEDAAINVEQWLSGKQADKFARVEATAFILGNGVNKPRGILTYPDGDGRGKVKRIASGAAGALTPDAIKMMPFELKDAYAANAAWMMKRSTVQSVMLFKDGDGQYMWRPGLIEGQPSTLVGHALRMADDMPAVQAGSLSVSFGDYRRAYTIVDRLGITVLRDPFTEKPFVQFYSRKRVGGDVVDFEAYALIETKS